MADTIERWFTAGAYDGLNLAFRTTEDLDTFIERVVPLLQAKGIFRTEYEASTLRGQPGHADPGEPLHRRAPRGRSREGVGR